MSGVLSARRARNARDRLSTQLMRRGWRLRHGFHELLEVVAASKKVEVLVLFHLRAMLAIRRDGFRQPRHRAVGVLVGEANGTGVGSFRLNLGRDGAIARGPVKTVGVC